MSTSSRYPSVPHLLSMLMFAGLFFVGGCSDMVSLESTEREAFGREVRVSSSQVDGRDTTAWGTSAQAPSKKGRDYILPDYAVVSTDARKIIDRSDSLRYLQGTRPGAESAPSLAAIRDR